MAAKLYQQSCPHCRRTEPVELPSRLIDVGSPDGTKSPRLYVPKSWSATQKLYLVTAGAVLMLNAALSRVVGPECEVRATQHRL